MTSSGRTAVVLALPLVLLIRGAGAPQTPQSGQAPQLLHPLFQGHAVLQRARPINLYGETVPGAAVTVTLGSAAVEARADANGHWSARLPALSAGGPYTLTASANGETRTASDIRVGDVFFCSGHSNSGLMRLGRRARGGTVGVAVARRRRHACALRVGRLAGLSPDRRIATARGAVRDGHSLSL